MKESKRAIEEIFKNKEFARLMQEYYSGEFDPMHTPEEWPIDESWGVGVDRFPMNDEGARYMNDMKYNQKNIITVNTTFDEDTMFSAISVDKEHGAVFLWFLDLIEYDYEDIKSFDPYNYDEYNEWKTLNSTGEDEDEEW